MERTELKRRLRKQVERLPYTQQEIADGVGVHVRTLRRWLSPKERLLPDAEHLSRLSKKFHVGLDRLLCPEHYFDKWAEEMEELGRLGAERAILAFACQLYHHIPALWIRRDLTILAVTRPYAALYDVEPAEIIDTHLFNDWNWYGQGDKYGWMESLPSPIRESAAQNFLSEAEACGSSGQPLWYLAPSGNLRRMAVHCWHLPESDTFLFASVPMVGPQSDYHRGVISSKGRDFSFRFISVKGEKIEVPSIAYDAVLYYIKGWDVGRIASEMGISRSEVTAALDLCTKLYDAEDHHHMREMVIDRFAEEMMCEYWNTLRLNCDNLP